MKDGEGAETDKGDEGTLVTSIREVEGRKDWGRRWKA